MSETNNCFEQTTVSIRKLTRLLEVSCSLNSIDLDLLLQQVVDAAVELTRAEMGGMLVLHDGQEGFEYFKVSGWPKEPDGFPTGAGVLSIPYLSGKALLEDDIRRHPNAVGTPPGHPNVQAFLAVPLCVHDKPLGSLFVGNGPGGNVFSEEDRYLLKAFATQAAVVIENTRLYERSEKLAILEERNRIAHSLHETVVQYLFTIGLEAERGMNQTQASEEQLSTIRKLALRASDELRSAIFALTSISIANQEGLPTILRELANEFERSTGIQVSLLIPDHLGKVPSQVHNAVYRIVREALSNVQKHADANAVAITISRTTGKLTLVIQDNGQGVDFTQTGGLHFGLLTMKEVAENASGCVEIFNNEDDVGTIVRAIFPLSEEVDV